MANKDAAELPEPSADTFHDRTSFVMPELPAVLVAPELAVVLVWNDEFDAAVSQSFA